MVQDFQTSFLCSAAELAAAIDRLRDEGALSLPLIPEAACRTLLQASKALVYRAARPAVGAGMHSVTQDFDLCYDIPGGSPFGAFAADLTELTNQAFNLLVPRPYEGGFSYNDLIVQRYPPGSLGISPHLDHLRYEGLVSLVILAGDGRFMVCEDRSGENAREIPSPSGCLLLMRAPGLHGRRDRPFHFLTDVTTPRLSFGLRYDVRAGEEEVFQA